MAVDTPTRGSRRRGRADATSDAWTDVVVEAPRAGTVDDRKSVRRAKWVRRYVLCATVLLPVALLAIIGLAGKANQPAPASPAAVSGADSAGKTAATLAVTSWLQGEPSPLPDGQILSWDGAKPQPSVTITGTGGKKENPSYSVEVDSFTVVDGSGRTYTASVAVAVDPRGGARALGGPSLIPTVPAAGDGWDNGSPWAGRTASSSVSDSVSQAIKVWADAYTSGDPGQLRQVVGDPDGGHQYVPLTGVQSVTTDVVAATQMSSADVLVVEVALDIVWDGQTVKQGDPTSNGPKTTIDVRVERADSGAPAVVAWGGPGTGPTLQAYGNAVTGDDRALPTAVPTPSTTTGG